MGGYLLSSEYMYQGNLLNLRLDRVSLPDGKEVVREIVEHPGAVAVVALDENQNVTMVKQFRDPAQRTMLEVPAGTLRRGELPEDCAKRELEEETGLVAGKLEPLAGFFVSPGYCTEYIYAFLATDLSAGQTNTDEDEFIDIISLPMKEALAMIGEGQIQDSKSISCLMLTARRAGL